MKNRENLKKIFNRDRKTLYTILSILLVSVLVLTVAYASLSTTLNINGNAEVTAASWDIYLDNVQLNSQSATTTAPTITDSKTATFSTTLTKPGDYYMFTIDVVNNGTIDAMINSITKTPELSDTQKKYLNYVIEYQNGNTITTKQLVEKKSFIRIKVKVQFREDISASDLPTAAETLNLSFKVNYVQSDDSSENVSINNNGKLVKIVSGDYDTVGSEICIGEECFYVISSDEDNVTMLAKYNLYVGNMFDEKLGEVTLPDPTGKQSSKAVGFSYNYSSDNPILAVLPFSATAYWHDDTSLKSKYGTSYPAYVYDENSILYPYIENYKNYLIAQGIKNLTTRLITINELFDLGCSYSDACNSPLYSWVTGMSYWTGFAYDSSNIMYVNSYGSFASSSYSISNHRGIRPVITISKSEF